MPRSDLFLFFNLALIATASGYRPLDGDTFRTLTVAPALCWFLMAIFVLAALCWRYVASIGTVIASYGSYLILMATRVSGSVLGIRLVCSPLGRTVAAYLKADDRKTFTLFCSHLVLFRIFDALIMEVFGELTGKYAVFLRHALYPPAALATVYLVFSLLPLARTQP